MEPIIYVMRHGKNEISRDKLSKEGIAETKKSAKLLQKELQGIEKLVIYTSPAGRAKETADILMQILKKKSPELFEKKEISDTTYGEVAYEFVKKINDPCSIVVTHMNIAQCVFIDEKNYTDFANSEYRRFK
jgi:phosphohistidine phosphatase SixA